MHLEGPFISRRGAACIRPIRIATPSVEILDQFLAAADGLVKILTLAPEFPGALELIESRRRGRDWWSRWDTPTPITSKRERRFRRERATLCISTMPCGRFRTAIRAFSARS